MASLQLRARALAFAKEKKKKEEAEEASRESLVNDILSRVVLPTPNNGRDGRDAPELSEIVKAVTPLLPEAKVEQTTVEKTIVQKINTGELEEAMSSFIEGKLPEMEKSLRPKVELIREDVSDEKLEGFVTKEDLDKALKRVQDAITYHSGGGSPPPDTGPITNIIYASEDTNVVQESDLDSSKINIVHATVSGSTVQLPKASPTYIVWVEDAVLGGGNITITRAS